MTLNYINLSVNINPLNKIPVVDQPLDSNFHILIDSSSVSDKLHEFLKQFDIYVGNSSVLFYTPPFGELGIHLDGGTISNKAMLNFVWGSSSHKMSWYKLKDNNNLEVTNFSNNDPYIKINKESVTLIDETVVQYPTLVRVGVPHAIKNYDSIGRWCLSLDVRNNDNTPGIDFDHAVKLFKEIAYA